MSGAEGLEQFHATSVAVGNNGVMIMGPSASGKSALALELIGMGGELVADDLTFAMAGEDGPVVVAPDRLQGVIEARGVGLINVPWRRDARLSLVIDMGEIELDRMPRAGLTTQVAGFDVETLRRVDAPYFACSIFNILRHGRYSGQP